ncbi:MAG: nucleoside triphosphate pyrophosphohydrolase, partial [Bacteroidales bacterium]|nr:nucleoside triphosphate pyrophosphohydrolase [Bacteroidales bacterium]
MENEQTAAFQRLSDILDTLRRECPWDRKQTMKSLRYLTIEEVHELSEAVVAQSGDDIKKELGDVAMHILFYCKIAEDEGLFTTADVYNSICDKLISRHPF